MSAHHPYIVHRSCLKAWQRWQAAGKSSADFDALVMALDARVSEVDGHGVAVTPLIEVQAASARTRARVLAKVEAMGVSGSHKSRHLFGVMLDLLVQERLGLITERAPLAIASCGNAALAAAVVASAEKWPIQVFVPTDAAESTMARLSALGAEIVTCPRSPSELGDPTVLRFREAVRGGAIPFCCQGTEQPVTFDGGVVLGHEIAMDLERRQLEVDHVFVQVGGGALMTGIWRGMRAGLRNFNRRLPRFHGVQTLGGYPLVRAWRIAIDDVTARLGTGPAGGVEPRIAVEIGSGPAAEESRASIYRRMREEPECYMWAWHNPPRSIASGILDDETYDFIDCVEAMIDTGGVALAVSEDALREAQALTDGAADVPISYTGAAGLAGALTARELGIVRDNDRALVILSGARR